MPTQRGCQLSLRLQARGAARPRWCSSGCVRRGIVADWRAADIIRLAPVPLYNSYEDVLRCARSWPMRSAADA